MGSQVPSPNIEAKSQLLLLFGGHRSFMWHLLTLERRRREGKKNVGLFYTNMQCPFANSLSCLHGDGGRVGLTPICNGWSGI